MEQACGLCGDWKGWNELGALACTCAVRHRLPLVGERAVYRHGFQQLVSLEGFSEGR